MASSSGRNDPQLSSAKRSYREASSIGNHQEEARWANMIGDILKQRGEYVESLKWLRIDYEVSIKYLPEKQLLPTCQSLGEVYLRLGQFKEALNYQKKHLELAKDSDDLVEEQRATTQLGRTYHEMFLKSDDDHYAVRNAKKYFRSSMKLACSLKETAMYNKSNNFLKEFIDAHNNLGMLEMDLDNLEEAEKILLQGLKICDDEEVNDNDDGRSRLHHNLGSVYMELRMWSKARDHIEKDIVICKKIGHRQGEAKGYINLGELHYRVQKYEEALVCYQKALDIAKSMEDEDVLVDNIDQNIETMKEAAKVMDELKKEEQILKKLARTASTARGTSRERKCLLRQSATLDRLIEKSSIIFAWMKHLEFAKRKKRVASELCDKEKLSDSFLCIGESYHKLRNFTKSCKWYAKSLSTYKSIGNMEGQALAKVNIGDILDSEGDWTGALKAFEEGYRIASEAKLHSIQISALENMHYSHMIRFDNVEEARKLQLTIKELKRSLNSEVEAHNLLNKCCSETETEEDEAMSDNKSNECNLPDISESTTTRPRLFSNYENFEDDLPLSSLYRSKKKSAKEHTSQLDNARSSIEPLETSPNGPNKSNDNQHQLIGRKRVRVILSDDEDEPDEVNILGDRIYKSLSEDVVTSSEFMKNNRPNNFSNKYQNISCGDASKDILSSSTPLNIEESMCSYKSRSSRTDAKNGDNFRSTSTGETVNVSNLAANGFRNLGYLASDNLLQTPKSGNFNQQILDDEYNKSIPFKVEDTVIQIDACSFKVCDRPCMELLKVEVACLYYLQLSEEKRSRGLLPIIRHLKCGDKSLESYESIEEVKSSIWEKGWIEAVTDGWVQKRLMKLYIDSCKKLKETPNMKLLSKLYNLEVSEDEVVVSECNMQDISIAPLLDALHQHKTIAMLDLAHNFLGNETMEKLQHIFMSSNQKYGGFNLDLHCNRFGPTSLFQICECPVLLVRLEVLNISGNRLTDACGSYLSTILTSCKALYSLNIENCSITSRTIQKMADAINSGSILAQLCIGHNGPISGNCMVNLITKLSTLKRFSELNLNGIKLGKPVINNLCELAKTACLSGLMLGGTNIGSEGALELTKVLSNGLQELVKLDLSFCGLKSHHFERLAVDIVSIGSILELNLGGSSVGQEGINSLSSLLANPQCCLRTLVLNNCFLGLAGLSTIIQALAENESLEELNLVENVDIKEISLECCSTPQGSLKSVISYSKLDVSNSIDTKRSKIQEAKNGRKDICEVNTDYMHLEVADSFDSDVKGDPVLSAGLDDSCTSSSHRNNSFAESHLIKELSSAIGMAKNLRLLDLSNNGFSREIAETLYTSWSSNLRCGDSFERHVTDIIIHFSVEGKICCGVKICCKKDL